jgi:hypothetical protein
MNIADKYYWIMNHPKYVPIGSDAVIEITPHMVCPETNCIEKLPILNTKLRFWVELMVPYEDEDSYHGLSHEWELDCGGDTWEEAVAALYQLVLAKYGDYTDADIDKQHEEWLEDMKNKIPGYKSIFDELLEDLNDVSTSGPDLSIPIEKLEDYEIEGLKETIEHLEILLPVLQNKLTDPNITMKEYSDIELEIVCVYHDLDISKLNIKYGYNVELYGIRDENTETGEHSVIDDTTKSI